MLSHIFLREWFIRAQLFIASLEDEGRVAENQTVGSEDDHDGLKTDEQVLIPQGGTVAVVSVAELVDSIAASDQDEHHCSNEKADEGLELARPAYGRPHRAADDRVVDAQGGEADQGSDLEAQSRERDIHARGGFAVRSGGHGAADGLKDK